MKVVITTQLPESPLMALGYFRKEAQQQGWSAEQVREFMNVALSADHQHLIKLIEENIEHQS